MPAIKRWKPAAKRVTGGFLNISRPGEMFSTKFGKKNVTSLIKIVRFFFFLFRTFKWMIFCRSWRIITQTTRCSSLEGAAPTLLRHLHSPEAYWKTTSEHHRGLKARLYAHPCFICSQKRLSCTNLILSEKKNEVK